MKWFTLAVVLIIVAGCKPAGEQVGQVVDDVIIQRSKIEAGRAAQEKLQRINKQREEDINAAMGQ